MRESPILFSAPMVRAILDGRKTVTRRIVKPYRGNPIVNLAEAEPTLGYSGRFNDSASWGYEFLDDGAPASLASWPELCPYGKPGDRLWVRETWAPHPQNSETIFYKATIDAEAGYPVWSGPWRPSIHMPRRASRITLEVTGVRVERLHDISEEDARAEGAPCELAVLDSVRLGARASHLAGFTRLWQSINGAGNWDANPWVWVVEFRRIEQEARAHG